METLAVKGIAIVVLFVLGFIGGLLPLCCIKPGQLSTTASGGKSLTRRVISLLNSAAAGVFLSIALVHLLPEARQIFEAALNVSCSETESQFPASSDEFDWAGFTAACGFIFVVFLEQLMMWCLERSESSDRAGQEMEDSMLVRAGEVVSISGDESGDNSFAYGTLRTRSPSSLSQTQSDAALETHSQCSGASTVVKGLHDHQPLSSFRAIILLISLSLHSIFEGLALGLQFGFDETIELLIAISVHKAIESFTVLLQFAQIPDRIFLKWSSLLIFSFASPLGIAIGMPLANGSINPDTLLVNAILQGLATGTFMFVTFVELLPVELAGKDDRLLKCLCLLAGFGLMCGLTQI